MTTAKDVLKMIKDNDVKFVDFRFTDPRGKWQHVTFDVSMIEEDTFAEGQMFDGSSIAGWKAINESDMCLMPDPVTATIDPFFAETTMVVVCDVLEPSTGEPGDQSDADTDARRERHGAGREHERDSPSVQEPREDVAAEVVGAERLARGSVGDRLTRLLHQRKPGRAGGDRETVACGHLVGHQ